MKKNETRYSATKVISFAALLAMQTMPSSLFAQVVKGQKTGTEVTKSAKSEIYIKIDGIKGEADKMQLVAAAEGSCIFKNSANALFMVDAATGDMKPVSEAEYNGMQNAVKKNGKITFPPNNGSTKVQDYYLKFDFKETLRIMGIDKQKHIVLQTANGENIYLEPTTGDMRHCASGKHFKDAVIL
jgi:hypothetical protein